MEKTTLCVSLQTVLKRIHLEGRIIRKKNLLQLTECQIQSHIYSESSIVR